RSRPVELFAGARRLETAEPEPLVQCLAPQLERSVPRRRRWRGQRARNGVTLEIVRPVERVAPYRECPLPRGLVRRRRGQRKDRCDSDQDPQQCDLPVHVSSLSVLLGPRRYEPNVLWRREDGINGG